MKYLIQTVETWRFSNDNEAQAFIEDQKKRFEVKKSICENKQIKVKGEIEDEYVKCTITKVFNAEKEPDTDVSIDYEANMIFAREEEE